MTLPAGIAFGAAPRARTDFVAHPYWTLGRVWSALYPSASGHGGGRAMGASPVDDRPVRAIVTDTRAVQPGDVFVALRGDRFDGHDFLATAEAAGAVAVVVERADAAIGLGVPALIVHDTLRAYGQLASHWRTVWRGVPSGGVVIGVAGSNGKTSTKELLAAALGGIFSVHATRGNLNNLIGVPATLLSLPPEAEVAVVEMGTNVPGEIARLAEIVAPDITIITSIGEEHLEGLGSIDGVLREEADAATGSRWCVIPGDDASMAARLSAAIGTRSATIVRAGLREGDVRPDAWHIDADGRVVAQHGDVSVALPIVGEHNGRNAMLVMAVAQLLSVPAAAVAQGIASMPRPAMRSAVTPLGGRGAILLNDAYNANPPSAKAAIDSLVAIDGGTSRQRVAVLGTMRELGASAPALHDDVLRHALASPVDLIVAIGDFVNAADRLGAAADRVLRSPARDDAWPLLEPRLTPNAVILLKASRGVALEALVPLLTQWSER
jgi:UDP-N-acetylmuramoyl-tripeptide--D-alanyl-D-alanine ligase